ncbi:MAG: type II toxin-antitoxin system VapC family toxin [Nitrospirota bacterium]|nr:type II toxin-antitoxin system VapC family toxin [Nitrospirota bacterium]MDE3118026.1 type II toxin-antitoxin system VapC family toxin [Nitrospirota bacterium]MDE3224925.1 type II toxin-antitoxin system VapC family toxin [Nitrospirota bacterium]MDE3241776.1 type II toxin-antitoxin system VapC family toxin [Nitrospirota bacterium]
MPVYYFDTSALVKRYSRERGTKTVNALLAKRGRLAILGSVAIPEFYAALALKARLGELTRDDWYSVLFKFEAEADRGLYQFVTPSSRTFLATKQFILDYPFLRSAQALHLVLAQELRPLRLSFVSSDRQVLELCRPFGITPINPEDD